MQTKRDSWIEALTNTFIGMGTTFVFSPLIYWIADVEMNYTKMGLVTVLFTILSIARGYVVRRFFNKQEVKSM